MNQYEAFAKLVDGLESKGFTLVKNVPASETYFRAGEQSPLDDIMITLKYMNNVSSVKLSKGVDKNARVLYFDNVLTTEGIDEVMSYL